MPTRTRPTEADTSVSDHDREVHTYLHDTMSVLFGRGPPSDISPWLLYGPPSTPMYDAEKELSTLYVMNPRDYESINTTKLTSAMVNHTPELYYTFVSHFSQMSINHSIYAVSTPDGFRGHYAGPAEKVDKLQKSLDAQFDKMIKRWVDVPDTYATILLRKSIVDCEVLPELISCDIVWQGNLHGARFHELYLKASEGDVMPLVSFCVTRNFSRGHIITFVQGVTYSRVTSYSEHQVFLERVAELEKGICSIQQDVSAFMKNLTAWHVIDREPSKKSSSPRKSSEQCSPTTQDNGTQKTSKKRKNRNFHFNKNKRGKRHGCGT